MGWSPLVEKLWNRIVEKIKYSFHVFFTYLIYKNRLLSEVLSNTNCVWDNAGVPT